MSTFLILLTVFSWITFDAVLCSPQPSTKKVVECDGILGVVFGFILDMPQLRLVAKNWKSSFDHVSSFHINHCDKHLKRCLENYIINGILISIPATILLYKGPAKAYDIFHDVLWLNFKPPVDENEIAESYVIESRNRFRNAIFLYFDYEFFNPESQRLAAIESKDLFLIYKCILGAFPDAEASALLESVKFPLQELIERVAFGHFKISDALKILIDNHRAVNTDIIFRILRVKNYSLAIQLLENPLFRGMIEARDENSRRPLHYAAHTGRLDLLMKLIELNADINAFDGNSHKPIHKAAISGNHLVFRILYESGASVSHSSQHPSVLVLATTRGHLNIVRFILNETNFDAQNDLKLSSELTKIILSNYFREIAHILVHSDRLTFSISETQILLKDTITFFRMN